ncbi:alpha/beta fold hydrolase [Actinokineospora pegani]|uniref:alpha/beta fold hydrolase n=1 Tax=Actinokineospora pegani TaxID=2654637 RepID=UPI0012EABB60|nr:alpha/beta hydrolase [Actinokineospora pegani]
MRTRTLAVAGARLHHEVRGCGPLVLLIGGGVYDAWGLRDLADALAERFTVLSYDRRGNSRSPLAGERAVQRVEEHADDAHRLITEVGGGPAFVFGNSSGALIGLELAARHPGDVRLLAAHEAPLLTLLPDPDRWRRMVSEIGAAYAQGGYIPALGVFGAAMGMTAGGAEGPDTPDAVAAALRMGVNADFFIGYEVPGFATHTPPLDLAVPVVPLVGADSAGEPPHEATLALATRLGVGAVTVPGGHGGFGEHPAAFATTLTNLFEESTQ